MAILFRVFAFASVIGCTLSENMKLQERFSWKQVDFDFQDDNARTNAIQNGDYIPENNLPLGVERWKNKLFVTLPRWKGGTAASLTYIDLDSKYVSSLVTFELLQGCWMCQGAVFFETTPQI